MSLVAPGACGVTPAAALLPLLQLSLATAAPGRRAGAQATPRSPPPTTGVVAGRVTARADSGSGVAAAVPIVGAMVLTAGGTVAATTTDAGGRYVLAPVPAGTRTVRVRLLGYRTAERAVRVPAGDTVRLDVTLEPEAQQLAGVRTSARPADVEAFESRPNVGTLALDAAAFAGVPSVGEPDVVRVVQLLPGVVARNDFNTGLNVRGGEADQNLILLDGFPIYNPFHLGGLFSTFMDATVGGIELAAGAVPARHGGRLSSVLDVRSAEEARGGVHGSADVSALAGAVRLAGALGGGPGTWSVAARRTYADAAAAAFTDNVFPYHFRDAHARATYTLPGGVRLAVTAYGGKDVLDLDIARYRSDANPTAAGHGHWAVDWENQVVGVAAARDVGRATIEQRVSTSGFAALLDVGSGASTQRSRVRDLRAAGSLALHGTAHDQTLGYEVAAHRVRYAVGSPETSTTEVDLVQRPVSAAAWAEDLWRLSPRWLLEGGLRAEALTGRDWAALSPRGAVKYFATPRLALTAGAGRVTQVMHSLAGDGPLRYFDLWVASDPHIPVSAAWHWVAGVEQRLGGAGGAGRSDGGSGSVRVEGYVKRYERLLDANRSEDPRRHGDEFYAAAGRSYGLDLLARWRAAGDGASGWVAYTYGVSTRWRDTLRWAPGHDRRHDLNVVATWRLARYRLGARFGYATGTPYTPIVGEVARRMYDPSRDRWGTGDPAIRLESLGGARNGARFPPNHRLDLDLSREFRVRRAVVAPYASVVNAYNAKNVFVYLYDYSTDRPTRRAISQFPVLPSAGVRVAF